MALQNELPAGYSWTNTELPASFQQPAVLPPKARSAAEIEAEGASEMAAADALSAGSEPVQIYQRASTPTTA